MGVYIKGRDKGWMVQVLQANGIMICFDSKDIIEVPEPHGRLIDADALIKASGVTIQITGDENARVVAEALESIYQDIEDAQTVIDEEG